MLKQYLFLNEFPPDNFEGIWVAYFEDENKIYYNKITKIFTLGESILGESDYLGTESV